MATDVKLKVQEYIDRGWAVIALPPLVKKAKENWQKKTYTIDDFEDDSNVAVKLGDPSGGLIDYDLDCKEAVEVCRMLMPATSMVFGRKGKPDSHYLFLSPGAKTAKWSDVDGTNLMELRSTGGYTVFAPSIWTRKDEADRPIPGTEEELYFDRDKDLAPRDPEQAFKLGRSCAVGTLLARHWPGSGARHEMIGPLCGMLLRAGEDPLMVPRLVEAAAKAGGDGDSRDRMTYASSTVRKFTEDPDARLTGGKRLKEYLDEKVVARLRSWYRLSDDDAIQDLNDLFAFTYVGNTEAIIRKKQPPVFHKPNAVRTEYSNVTVATGVDAKGNAKMENLFDAWLKSATRDSRIDGPVFAPPPFSAAETEYNLWSGFAVQPADGSCDLFIRHLYEVLCCENKAHFDYLMDWLAYCVQFPGLQTEVAVVLKGKRGTGKGVFARAMGELFGHHFAHLDKVEQLTGRFNNALSGKAFAFLDEAFWAGDKKDEGALKRLITEPTLWIERKGIDGIAERNCLSIVMATNEDWAVPAGFGERRFFVLDVSDLRAKDLAWFGALDRERKAGGMAAFLKLLLARPTSRERVLQAPHTASLRHQQTLSLRDHLEWWQECLFDGRVGVVSWSPWMPGDGIYAAYLDWMDGRSRKRFALSKVAFGTSMAPWLSARKSFCKKVAGEVVRGWAVRDLASARAHFDQQAGSSTDWPDHDSTPASLDL